MAVEIPMGRSFAWTVIGIDPGVRGAMSVVGNLNGDPPSKFSAGYVDDLPVLEERARADLDVIETLRTMMDLVEDFNPIAIGMERVHALPKQGVSSTFRFGVAYGALQGICACSGVPLYLVTPQMWKKSMRLGAGKDAARALAKARFPSAAEHLSRVKDEHRAEALLIAHFTALEFLQGRIDEED